MTNANNVAIVQNILRNNVSTGYGGAIYLATTPSVNIFGNLIYNNKGISGGIDLVVPGSTVGAPAGALVNNTIVGNMAIGTGSGSGSDVYIGGNLAQYQIVNNIVGGYTNGQIAFNCGTAYAAQTLTPLVFDHNDIYSLAGSTNTPVGGACTSPASSFGNISVDPKFTLATSAAITTGTADFHLASGSPAVDTGTNALVRVFIATDLDGNPRAQDATGQGYPITDMGAYELSGLATIFADGAELIPSTYKPVAGASFTLKAYLDYVLGSAAPTGSFTFYEDGTAIGTVALNGGSATLVLPTGLTVGLHTLVASFTGTSAYPPVSSVLQYVQASGPTTTSTVTTLTSSLNPSPVGQSVTFTAHVAASNGSTPVGTVNFADGAVQIGSAPVDASGNAAITTGTLAQGSHSLTAAFIPAAGYQGSLGSLTQQVKGATANAVLTVTPGSVAAGTTQILQATITGTSAGVPTGTVAFLVDAVVIGTVAVAAPGVGTLSYVLPSGTHTVTCVYSGDSNYAPINCNAVTVTIAAAPTKLTLAAAPSPAPALTPVTLTAHLALASNGAPSAGATIAFAIDGAAAGKAITTATGDAVFIAPGLAAGTHTLVATFAGDTAITAATSPTVPLVAFTNATATTLIAAPNPGTQNQPVTLVASVAALTGVTAPLGTVQFFDGATLLALYPLQPPAQGVIATATLVTSALTPGAHTVKAVYIPATSPTIVVAAFATSAPATLTVTITPQSFTIAPASPTLTLQTEHHASIGVSLTSIGGLSGRFALSCGPLPDYATCRFNQTTLSLPANGSVTTSLTIDTDAILGFKASADTPAGPLQQRGAPVSFALAALALLPLVTRRRRRNLWLRAIPLVFLAAASSLALTACSGKYPGHTAPGTYAIPLIATGTPDGASTPVTQTATLTLVVTP